MNPSLVAGEAATEGRVTQRPL